jgi:hypothetical protein
MKKEKNKLSKLVMSHNLMLATSPHHYSFSTSTTDINDISDIDITRDWLNSLTESQRDEAMVSEKRVFVLYNFFLDHPDSQVLNYSQLAYLIQEKGSLRKWNESIKDKWSLLNDVPEWLIGDSTLREYWMANYQSELIKLRLIQQSTLDANNKARKLFEETVKRNDQDLAKAEDAVYDLNPVILIHKITPAALNEAELLELHSLTKEERKIARKGLVNDYKLNLLRQYNAGEITKEQLIEIVKLELR